MTGYEFINAQLQRALIARDSLLHASHESAFRLFNGYSEGCPNLVADLYANTLVLFAQAATLEVNQAILAAAQDHLLSALPWVDCVVQKMHPAPDLAQRRGSTTFGQTPTRQISENGIWYAVDLRMNQDASFYLDTRGLRAWLHEHTRGESVLNLFAYTGALGIAALAGGARRVVQVDRSRKFLALASHSCALNDLDAAKMELSPVDFFSAAAHFKRTGELFDCVIVDPPFFSSTDKGRIDLVSEAARVINKVRPLVKDGGVIVAINNALFLKGADYIASLEQLGQGGYLSIESVIPVPADCTGYPETVVAHLPADPAPFNHPTKIAILRVRRKPVLA
jgi:23S rRNA (cytosine1962-C5)-methyltransferase